MIKEPHFVTPRMNAKASYVTDPLLVVRLTATVIVVLFLQRIVAVGTAVWPVAAIALASEIVVDDPSSSV